MGLSARLSNLGKQVIDLAQWGCPASKVIAHGISAVLIKVFGGHQRLFVGGPEALVPPSSPRLDPQIVAIKH
jgi:hypothetical protein